MLLASCANNPVTKVPTQETIAITATLTQIIPTSTPTKTNITSELYETVTIQTSDGTKLSGRIFGSGETAVILTHKGYTTQGSWFSMAKTLEEEGFTTMTFDFRGVGQSEGFMLAPQAVNDLKAAIAFLEARDFTEIICVGASYGGTACLSAAKEYPFTGLVVLASRMSEGEPTRVSADDFSGFTMPKLFVCTENDHNNLAAIAQEMYELSPEPKEIIFYPGGAHATDIFATRYGKDLKEALLNFLLPLK
jgi:esterase/lipase